MNRIFRGVYRCTVAVTIKVFIVEDSVIMRKNLQSILFGVSGIEVVEYAVDEQNVNSIDALPTSPFGFACNRFTPAARLNMIPNGNWKFRGRVSTKRVATILTFKVPVP